MTKINSNKFILFILLLFSSSIFAQQSTVKEVNGRVVELINGKVQGVPKIDVHVEEIDDDITAPDGSFKVYVPTTKNFVKIILKNTQKQVLTPIDGLINLPPNGHIDILVCAQENRELKAKVDAVNKQVRVLQGKYSLSTKRIEELQKEMMQKVVDYERQIQEQKNLVVREKSINAQVNEEKDRKIQALENQLQNTLKELMKAKDDQFLKKKEQLEIISSGLRQYLDALYNLHGMLLPDRIHQYFINNRASIDKFSQKIDEYNAARKTILEKQDVNITSAQHYWEDPSVSTQLRDTYNYLLNEVHDKTVYPVEFSVNDIIKKYIAKQLGSQQATKKAKDATFESYSQIKVKATVLEEKINNTIEKLKQSF